MKMNKNKSFWHVFMGSAPRLTILSEWLCHFNDLAVGETGFRMLFAGDTEGEMSSLLSH